MLIIPMSSVIHTIPAADAAFGNIKVEEPEKQEQPQEQPATFMDALAGLWDQAVEAQAVKSEDMLNIMLGDEPSLEKLQVNIAKAQIATELFVNVKNAAVDAYNEIIRMSI